MPQIDGKQLKDGSVAEAKAATAWTQDLIKRTGSVAFTSDQSMGGQKLTTLGAPVNPGDAARLQDIQNIPWKESCKAASTANIDLSTGGELTIDGIGLTSGDRCLVKNQSGPNEEENGIYIVASGSWSRSADNDSTQEMQGAVVNVDEGSTQEDTRWAQTEDDVTVGTDDVTWVNIGGVGAPAYPTSGNKAMVALVTTGDGDKATNTTVAATPAADGYVKVEVNGVGCEVGDSSKLKDCYFSADSGSTAKSIANIASGDELFWNGSVIGYELAVTDVIDAFYNV